MSNVLSPPDPEDYRETALLDNDDDVLTYAGTKWLAMLACGHVRAGDGVLVPRLGWRIHCFVCDTLQRVEGAVSSRPERDPQGCA